MERATSTKNFIIPRGLQGNVPPENGVIQRFLMAHEQTLTSFWWTVFITVLIVLAIKAYQSRKAE